MNPILKGVKISAAIYAYLFGTIWIYNIYNANVAVQWLFQQKELLPMIFVPILFLTLHMKNPKKQLLPIVGFLITYGVFLVVNFDNAVFTFAWAC